MRNLEIFKSVVKGKSFRQVGLNYGISRSRAYDIYRSVIYKIRKNDHYMRKVKYIPVKETRRRADLWVWASTELPLPIMSK